MATNLTVNFIGKNHLSKTTAVASRDLKKLGDTAKNVGNTINKSLGAVGLGIGFATLTNALKNATKAASEDRKAQGLLANALKQTLGATDYAIAGAERYIKQTQLSTAVIDDDLRPALALAVRGTGSLSRAQEILNVALDVSAEKGLGLQQVTKAIVRAQDGNVAGLQKLIPGYKVVTDVVTDLEAAYGGTAEAAANLDPYKRLEIIFNDIQEEIGMALLPSLEKFGEYVTSPEGNANLREIVTTFVEMGKAVGNIIDFLIKNSELVKALITSVVFLKVSWAASTTAVKLYTIMTGNAVRATKLLRTALITTGVGAALVVLGELAAGWTNAAEAKKDYFDVNEVSPEDVIRGEAIAAWKVVALAKKQIIPEEDDTWNKSGKYEMYGEYVAEEYDKYVARKKARQKIAAKEKADNAKDAAEAKRVAKEKRQAAVRAAKELADKVRAALDSKIQDMKSTAETFRDSVNVAFGSFGEDENSVFNVDYFKAKLQRMVAAAKGFAGNIAKIMKIDPSGNIANELIAMGPAAGNIAAKALLTSGDLTEIVGLKSSLYQTGAQSQAVAGLAGTSNNTYEININKSVVSAADIIRSIKALEKSHGRKYLVN